MHILKCARPHSPFIADLWMSSEITEQPYLPSNDIAQTGQSTINCRMDSSAPPHPSVEFHVKGKYPEENSPGQSRNLMESVKPRGFWREIGRTVTVLSMPTKPVADAPGFLQGMKAIVLASRGSLGGLTLTLSDIFPTSRTKHLTGLHTDIREIAYHPRIAVCH